MGERRAALISSCGQFRYWLTRRWGGGPGGCLDGELSILIWVMLNPSIADADIDDPTIRRVRGFTKREGYDGFTVVNVWALRATSPKDLHQRRRAYEPENIDCVEHNVRGRDVVVAWGANVVRGPGLQRICMVLKEAKSIRCLGLTKSGEPRHPLMLRGDTPLEPWWVGKRNEP